MRECGGFSAFILGVAGPEGAATSPAPIVDFIVMTPVPKLLLADYGMLLNIEIETRDGRRLRI